MVERLRMHWDNRLYIILTRARLFAVHVEPRDEHKQLTSKRFNLKKKKNNQFYYWEKTGAEGKYPYMYWCLSIFDSLSDQLVKGAQVHTELLDLLCMHKLRRADIFLNFPYSRVWWWAKQSHTRVGLQSGGTSWEPREWVHFLKEHRVNRHSNFKTAKSEYNLNV